MGPLALAVAQGNWCHGEMARKDVRSTRKRRAAARQRRQKQLRIAWAVGALLVAVGVSLGLLAMAGGSSAYTVEVALTDYTIEGDLVAPVGHVRLSAVNVGAIPHNVGLRGGPIGTDLRPGGSTDLDLGELAPGTYELYCDISDHVVRGMVASLVVTEPQ
jgi:plastocyanin